MPFDDYKIPTREMTSDEVLTLLGEFIVESGWVTDEDITRELPASALLEACDFAGPDDVAASLNAWFEISVPLHEWKTVLPPPIARPLGGVCDLIARHARVPAVQPVCVMGDRSLAAGAFLAIRRMLADEGADVTDLRPSSPLAPYLRNHIDTVVPRLRRLAPGRLGYPRVDDQLSTAAGVGYLLGYALLFGGWWLGLPWRLKLAGGASLVLFLCLARFAHRLMKPTDVRFGDARTFRDLARIVVGERCLFSGFPVVPPRDDFQSRT